MNFSSDPTSQSGCQRASQEKLGVIDMFRTFAHRSQEQHNDDKMQTTVWARNWVPIRETKPGEGVLLPYDTDINKIRCRVRLKTLSQRLAKYNQ